MTSRRHVVGPDGNVTKLILRQDAECMKRNLNARAIRRRRGLFSTLEITITTVNRHS